MAPGDAGGVVSDTGATGPTSVWAAEAKLTVSLRVTGVRPDGYHLLDAEMVTVDLADTLELTQCDPADAGLEVTCEWPDGTGAWRDLGVGDPADNLVTRALGAVGRSARARLVKRIPPGAGLGGGSADAAAVLRWAGVDDPTVAASIGADVPFCVRGGRARVTGIGERVQPLGHLDRGVVLLLPPFGVDTAAVYRAYDRLAAEGRRMDAGTGGNDLEVAALVVEPRLAVWRDALAEATGRVPRLAGSGSTWFVDGDAAALGVGGRRWVEVEGQRAPLVGARTTPGGAAVLR